MTAQQYDRQAHDEQIRHTQEYAAWRAEHKAEARAEEIPLELAARDGSELLDWICDDSTNVVTRLELLLAAVAQYGATVAGSGHEREASGIMALRCRELAESMIDKAIAEDRS